MIQLENVDRATPKAVGSARTSRRLDERARLGYDRIMRGCGVIFGVSLVLMGCDEDEGDSDSSTTGPSTTTSSSTTTDSSSTTSDDPPPQPAWAVGEAGTMLRIDADGSGSGYPLDEDADLLAIDCLGSHVAWASGSDGTVIRTVDGGQTWTRIDLETRATLRGIDIVHPFLVYVAGDDGAFHLTQDGGVTWQSVDTAPVDFSAVATDGHGEVALVTALDGSIWRYEHAAGRLWQVHASAMALRGISMSTDGEEGVAVGELGTWLESHDGGVSWVARDVDTTRDLHAVQLGRAGGIVIAVGQAGVVVRASSQDVSVDETLDPALTLRAVHASANGEGVAVGDAGVVLLTRDHGETWLPAPQGLDFTLHGVDALGDHAHL
mgnify:CR=1 FL=1